MTIMNRMKALFLLAILALASPSFAAQSNDNLRYTFASGDTLFDFGESYLAGRSSVAQVQKVNNISNPHRIPVGTEIEVPRSLLKHKPVDLKVLSWSGPVRINGQAVAVGTELREGQLVSTGRRGFVSFRATGGGVVTLPSNSRVRLDRARRYLLDDILDVSFTLLSGRGTAKVPTLKRQERFEMRTPVAVTAVRGTEFRVAYDESQGRGITEVVEGTVAVDAAGQSSTAEAGFGVASTSQGVGTQEALLPPPSFDEPGSIQTGEKLVFELAQDASAENYRVQIARDAGFLDLVDEQIAPAGEVAFDPLDNGRYFVRGRAIAQSGVEGLSETYGFRRKRLGSQASTERSPLGDGFLFKWIPEGEGKTYFAFQLWREENPASLLVDETGLTASGMVVTDLDQGAYMWRVAALQAEDEGLLKVWGPAQKLIVSE